MEGVRCRWARQPALRSRPGRPPADRPRLPCLLPPGEDSGSYGTTRTVPGASPTRAVGPALSVTPKVGGYPLISSSASSKRAALSRPTETLQLHRRDCSGNDPPTSRVDCSSRIRSVGSGIVLRRSWMWVESSTGRGGGRYASAIRAGLRWPLEVLIGWPHVGVDFLQGAPDVVGRRSFAAVAGDAASFLPGTGASALLVS
jgi:hypothetical protein